MSHVRIPLKRRVRHASYTRSSTDTLIVACRLDDGTIGWGEGLPRTYVTGEDIHSAWNHLRDFDHGSLTTRIDSLQDALALVDSIELPRPDTQRDSFGNAARCALELAILDASCRALQLPLSAVVHQLDFAAPMRQRPAPVRYSTSFTAGRWTPSLIRALRRRAYGFRQCKIKVGIPHVNDPGIVQLAHRVLGSRVGLRLDANEAWKPADVPAKIRSFGVPLEAVEQPVPHELVGDLARYREQIHIPIMLDESVCSLEDAKRAVEENLCDAFNIRLSKCGGVVPALRMARYAHDHGLKYQFGCQVGETGILSAAGRQIACSLKNLLAVEGSYDRFLVKEPLTVEDVTFGYGGSGEPLADDGLGVTVDTAALSRATLRRAEYPVTRFKLYGSDATLRTTPVG